jgi:hypothetical protein
MNPAAPLYAGIGSRETPEPVLQYMRRVAQRLAQRGYILRSGAAHGADTAFEQGCDSAGGQKEIWLPWRGFNGHSDTRLYPSEEHAAVAATLHPAWDRLTPGPKKLHARNVAQVLGAGLDAPVAFVLCWTPDGCEEMVSRSSKTGGTGTAIALASRHAIPILNLFNHHAKDRLAALVLQP